MAWRLWILSLLSILVVAGCRGEARPEVVINGTPLSARPYQGAILAEPWPKPDFVLTDTAGRPFDFRKETEGYVTLLYFGYTHCPDICPAHMANIASALRKMSEKERSQVKVIMVTVDPERDTPQRLREWLDLFDRSFIGLWGSLDQINETGRKTMGERWSPPVKEFYQDTYYVNHMAFVVAYGKDNMARVIYPFGVSVQAYLYDLKKMVGGE